VAIKLDVRAFVAIFGLVESVVERDRWVFIEPAPAPFPSELPSIVIFSSITIDCASWGLLSTLSVFAFVSVAAIIFLASE